jgi:arsenate reductase
MFENLSKTIESIAEISISNDRKDVLQPLIDCIQNKVTSNQEIRINFICTHNSRRSHLAQVWAQTMAFYFNIHNVYCYSGGTEATVLFPKVAETLANQGFQIQQLNETNNPVYAIKFDKNQHPIIVFSKSYFDEFNPETDYTAILTCSQADGGCPFISGAEKRISITFDDPKEFDGTAIMNQKYAERSLQIASEMFYVFSKIKK